MKTLITQEMAIEMLKLHTHNRPINKANVAFIENQLKDGKFQYNGESIIISNNNALLDGRHRLTAIVNTGISATINIVKDVEETAFVTIDTGRARTASDVLASEGIQNSSNIATTVRKILTKYSLERPMHNGNNLKTSNTEIVDFYLEHKEIIEVMLFWVTGLTTKGIRFLNRSQSLTFLYLLGLDSKVAKYFIRELYTGKQETKSNCAILLREKLIDLKISRFRMEEKEIAKMFLYAFNKYKDGAEIKYLRFSSEILSFTSGDIRKLNCKLTVEDFQ